MRSNFVVPALTSLSSLCLLMSFSSLNACAVNDADDETVTDSADVKKKVKPNGGNAGTFELGRPNGLLESVGTFRFSTEGITLGSKVEKAPGAYELRIEGSPRHPYLGTTMTQIFDRPITITNGSFEKITPASLRIRFAELPTLGAASVTIAPTLGNPGYLLPANGWFASPRGASIFALPGKLTVNTSADRETTPPQELTLQDGDSKEIILPTTRIVADLDAYDRTYPTAVCAGMPTIGTSTPSNVLGTFRRQYAPRNADGSVDTTTYVAPYGTGMDVVLSAYGITRKIPTVANGTVHVPLNRLEVDDMNVRDANGNTTVRKGFVRIEYLDGANVMQLNCSNFPTHSGIDLPDGTYRVTTEATGPNGVTTKHVEEVSFP